MLNLKTSEWLICAGLLILSLIPSLGILRLIELSSEGLLAFLPANPRAESAPVPIYFHVVSSIIFCILGAFQFLKSIRINHSTWHRCAGKLIIVSGIISAISALWMTHFYVFPENLQGNLLYNMRMIVGASMILFLFLAFYSVIKKQFLQHRAWIIRAYALGQGAGTQSFVFILWSTTVGVPNGLTRDTLMTVSWIINIILAEFFITRR